MACCAMPNDNDSGDSGNGNGDDEYRRAYQAGRLSVRREAGEHLFHRLLHADLRAEARRQEAGEL